MHTVAEVATMLGVHTQTVRGYIRDGQLQATRRGTKGRIFITDAQLAALSFPMSNGDVPEIESELAAMRTIAETFASLDVATRRRVLQWIMDRYS